MVNWNEIENDAQRGDALIKLGVYLLPSLETPEEKSNVLQRLESDLHLANLFEQWKSNGDKRLRIWGDNLGEKKKATLVEALLWQQFKKNVITEDAATHLQALLNALGYCSTQRE